MHEACELRERDAINNAIKTKLAQEHEEELYKTIFVLASSLNAPENYTLITEVDLQYLILHIGINCQLSAWFVNSLNFGNLY